MVKIRLLKKGRKGQPHYLIVAIDSRKKRDSKDYLDELGHYNPRSKDLRLDSINISKWIGNGAQPTLTVKNILKKNSLL